MVRGRCRPAIACTIHTKLPACQRSDSDGDGSSDGGDDCDDDNSGDGDGAVIEPLRSTQTNKLKRLQP
jgi:hypothetical protein